MHDLNTNSGKYVAASLGVIASIFMLMVSAYLNAVFMYRLGKTPMDGYVYAAAGVAADVLMALCPFFFFASFKNREWVRGAFTLLLWVALTAFSAQSAIGHLAGSRTEAASHRVVAATTYQDTRDELKRAMERQSWLPRPTKTQGAIQADIEKMKIQALWIQTNECNHAYNPASRKYCAEFRELTGQLTTAAEFEKLQAKIDELRAKSESVGNSNASVVGDADPGAMTISKLIGYDVKSTQGMLNILGALILLMGAGLGPYVSLSTVQKVERKMRAAPAAVASLLDVKAIDITPRQEARQQPGVLASPREIGADAKALLRAIGVPDKPCDKRPKDDRDHVAWRFLAWLAANNLSGDFSAEQIDQYYEAFCMADNRDPWATRVVKAELQQLKPLSAWTSMPRRDDGSRATVWTIKPPSVAKLHEILRKKGIAVDPPATADEPAEAQPNVFRLFGRRATG